MNNILMVAEEKIKKIKKRIRAKQNKVLLLLIDREIIDREIIQPGVLSVLKT